MAVAIDATGTETLSASAASPHTYTGLTTGGSLSNGAVTVIVIYDTHVTGSSATWDGVAMTLVASANNTGTNGRVELWGLSPIGAHTGNKTFSVSWTGGGNAQTAILGFSWTGVDQTGGATSFPNGTSTTGSANANGSQTVTVTSATGDAVIAGHATEGGFSSVNNTGPTMNSGAGFDNTATNISAAINRAAGAASVAMTAVFVTGSPITWTSVGVDIKAGGAAASVSQKITEISQAIRRASYW